MKKILLISLLFCSTAWAQPLDSEDHYRLIRLEEKIDQISKNLDRGYSDANGHEFRPMVSCCEEKKEPNFDCVLNKNYTDHDIKCSVCGKIVHPESKAK